MTDKKPETVADLVASMKPEVYQKLKLAVEIGKWESGEQLSQKQTANSLQAIIAYESKFVEPEHRIGFIEKASLKKTPCEKALTAITTDRNN